MDSTSSALAVAERLVTEGPDAAILVDDALRPLAYNAPYAEMTGIGVRELELALARGGSAFSLLGREGDQDLETAKQAIQSSQAFRFHEVSVANCRQQRFNCILCFIPVAAGQSKPVGLIIIFRDVTAESRVQVRFKQLLSAERARTDNLERQVQERTRELENALAEVTRLSRRDALTDLLNRRAFLENADLTLRLASRHERCASLFMFDLDHFKRFNDCYGHQVGDQVLVGAAATLVSGLRSTDSLARYGGEEFIALLSDAAADQVVEVAERCRRLVRNLPLRDIVPEEKMPLTVSVGVAVFPRDGATLESLIANADRALYYAKEAGRDRVVEFREIAQLQTLENGGRARARTRVLLACGLTDVAKMLAAVAPEMTCEIAGSAEQALELCRKGDFEVIVAHEDLGGADGLAFLYRTLPLQPFCLRLLIVDRPASPALVGRAHEMSVDRLITREEALAHFAGAIADELVAKEFRARKSVAMPHANDAGSLDRILREHALRFVYQPIVEMRDRAVLGYEALCRPTLPCFNGPLPMFEAAAHLGRIWELSRLVRAMAVEPLPTMAEGALLFINLHATDLSDPEFLRGEEILQPWSSRIVFEVTERAAIPEFERVGQNLAVLRERGFRFAIDDLGAGYASLNSIAALTPSFIKIDIGIVRNASPSSPQARLIRRIVEFADESDIRVIAEGVESAGEAETLVELGCHLAQGFYFAQPTAVPHI